MNHTAIDSHWLEFGRPKLHKARRYDKLGIFVTSCGCVFTTDDLQERRQPALPDDCCGTCRKTKEDQ